MEALNNINPQIPTVILPSVSEVTYEALDPKYRAINIVTTALLFIVIAVALTIFNYFNGIFEERILWFTVVIIWVLGFSVFLYKAIRSYDFMGYALRARDIIFKSGIWFRKVVIVPFNRVQHCEIEQGPIDRYFGLATLSLYTAGGSSSDLSINGLPLETANELKFFITKKIGSVDEEE